MKKEVFLIAFALSLLFCFYFVEAVSFSANLPGNATYEINQTVPINVSIVESDLQSLEYNWNGTNYTMFNDSLVLFYNFDNRSVLGENSTKVVDLSKYGNNASSIGTTSVNNSNGKYSGGLTFPGSYGNYARVVNNESLALSGDYTISLWIKPDSTLQGIWRPIFCKMQGTTYTADICDYGLWIASNNNNYHLRMDDDTRNWGTVTYNEWQHLAIVWDQSGKDVYFYIDGVNVLTDTSNFPDNLVQSGFDLHIGDTRNALEYFKGEMDNFMVWNRSLSEDEIYQLYASSLTKFNSTNWEFYVNQSLNATDVLPLGDYTYQIFAEDNADNNNKTELSTITIQEESNSPQIYFQGETPGNGIITANTSFKINISIQEENLQNFEYNWNGTNYTMFNDSLVLFYNFDNRSVLGENSTKVVDLSKYGNNGTVLNGTLVNLTGGVYHGAFEFDGIDDLIEVPYDSSYDINSDFSIVTWIYPRSWDSSSSVPGIISKRDSYASMDWELFYADGAAGDCLNELCFWYGNSGAVNLLDTLDYSPSLNTWTQIVLTKSGSTWTLYSDGVSQGSEVSATAVPTGDKIRLGWLGGGSGDAFFNGSLDDVQIWNRSLGEEEVYQLYASSLTKFNSTNWEFYVNQSLNATDSLPEGNYSYYLSGEDSSSNANESLVRTFEIDRTNPVINISYPVNGTNYTNTGLDINYSVVESNLDSCWYSNDTHAVNTTLSGCANLTSVVWSLGNHNVTVWANDSAGNEGFQSVNFTIIEDSDDESSDSEDNEEQSSSSSGGGSGSFLTQRYDSDKLEFRTIIQGNRSAVRKIYDSKGTDIDEIEIKAKNWINGNIYVVPYDVVPSDCSIENLEEYKFYKALDIDSDFDKSLIGESRLRVRVSKDWIYENNVSLVKAVKCEPYYEELKINYLEETEEDGVYDIYSNGFSTLAVLGVYEDSEFKENPEIKTISKFSYWWIFWTLLFMLIAFVLVNLHKKHWEFFENLRLKTKWFSFEFNARLRFGK